MISASKCSIVESITSLFQQFWFGSIRLHTFASNSASTRGDTILGECFTGSHLSPQIATVLPSPIHHIAPLQMTSLPLRMLCHAYEAELGFATSIIVQLGKNFDLKTLQKSNVLSCKSRHVCLAKSASLNFDRSLKPITLCDFGLHRSSHLIQCTFQPSPLCFPKNFLMRASISWHKAIGNLK